MTESFSLPVEEVLAAAPAPPAAGVEIGRSRRGRPLVGHRFGHGELAASLIAGCHADEPVGPETLRRLAGFLAALPPGSPLLAAWSFHLVPDANPDGAAANAVWSGRTVAVRDPRGGTGRGFDLAAYLAGAVREPPGEDVEFGFPRGPGDVAARPENRAVAGLMAAAAPLALHASLHGMGFAAGPWFLLDRLWIDRTAALRRALARRVEELGYRLHDVDRGGEKGFDRIAEGFTTRPDSEAMAAYFRDRGDEATARLFRPSSMEHARSLGGDPLTLVSEMPLFLLGEPAQGHRRPPDATGTEGRLALNRWLADLAAGSGPAEVARRAGRHGITPMPLDDQMRLQLTFVGEAMRAVAAARRRD